MNFFDTLQSATSQERQALFSVPVIRDALNGVVSLRAIPPSSPRPITTFATPCR